MRNLTRFLIVLAISLGSSLSTAGGDSDSQLRAKIVGTWQELRDLGCESPQQVMKIHSNGRFQVDGVIRTCDSSRTFVWKGTWTVKNGKMKYKTTFSSPKNQYPVGEEWEDEIISVSYTEWVMREQSTGNLSNAYRIK